MRILLYESLPDIERSAFIKRLRSYLRGLGHEVYCLVDAQTDFRMAHGQGEAGRINCIGPLCHNILLGNRDTVFVYTPPEQPFSPNASGHRRHFYEQVVTTISPECVFVWNGMASHHVDFIETIQKLSVAGRVLYLETAWLPQSDYIYCDSKGVNGNSSIAAQSLKALTETQHDELSSVLSSLHGNLAIDKQANSILVPLQIEEDSSIIHFSPFSTMQEFVVHLEQWIPPGYRVTIRPHPKSRRKSPVVTREDFTVDSTGNLYEILARTEIVVGINSTTLIEAMAFGCKTFAFGKGIFNCLESVCIHPNQSFSEAASQKQDVAPFLYDLLFRRQIPVQTLDGLSLFIGDSLASPSLPSVASPPYPFGKLLLGEFRYLVGRMLSKTGMVA